MLEDFIGTISFRKSSKNFNFKEHFHVKFKQRQRVIIKILSDFMNGRTSFKSEYFLFFFILGSMTSLPKKMLIGQNVNWF